MKKLLRYFVYANLLSAGCGLSLYSTTCMLTGVEWQWPEALLSFLAPFVLYNLLRWRGAQQTHRALPSERSRFMLAQANFWQPVLWVSALAAMLCVAAIWMGQSHEQRWVLVVAAFIAALYSIPVLANQPNLPSLRRNQYLKVATVSLTWLLITVLLPTAPVLKTLDLNLLLHIATSGLYILCNVLCNEIADAESDLMFYTANIAATHSPEGVLLLCRTILILTSGIEFFNCMMADSNIEAFAVACITIPILWLAGNYQRFYRRELVHPLLLDGALIVRGLSLLCLTQIAGR